LVLNYSSINFIIKFTKTESKIQRRVINNAQRKVKSKRAYSTLFLKRRKLLLKMKPSNYGEHPNTYYRPNLRNLTTQPQYTIPSQMEENAPYNYCSPPQLAYLKDWEQYQLLVEKRSNRGHRLQFEIAEEKINMAAVEKDCNPAATNTESITPTYTAREQAEMASSEEEGEEQPAKQPTPSVTTSLFILGFHECRKRQGRGREKDKAIANLATRFGAQANLYDLTAVDVPSQAVASRWIDRHLPYYTDIFEGKGTRHFDQNHIHDKYFELVIREAIRAAVYRLSEYKILWMWEENAFSKFLWYASEALVFYLHRLRNRYGIFYPRAIPTKSLTPQAQDFMQAYGHDNQTVTGLTSQAQNLSTYQQTILQSQLATPARATPSANTNTTVLETPQREEEREEPVMDASANLSAEDDQEDLRWYQMYQVSDYYIPGLKYNNPEHRAIMKDIYEDKVRPALEREYSTSSSSNVNRTPTQHRATTSETSPRATLLYQPSAELMPSQPNNVMVNITQQQYQLKVVTTETVKGFKEFIVRFKASYTPEARMQCITQEVKEAINSLVQVSIQMRKIPEEWKNWQQLDHDNFFDLLERLYPRSTRDVKSSMSARQ